MTSFQLSCMPSEDTEAFLCISFTDAVYEVLADRIRKLISNHEKLETKVIESSSSISPPPCTPGNLLAPSDIDGQLRLQNYC